MQQGFLAHLSVGAVLKLNYIYNYLQLGDIELLVLIQHACQISSKFFTGGNWERANSGVA